MLIIFLENFLSLVVYRIGGIATVGMNFTASGTLYHTISITNTFTEIYEKLVQTNNYYFKVTIKNYKI